MTSADRVGVMRDTLVHRGPDADGVYVSPDRRTGLGFRRLRIIDLSRDADQPMTNEDGTVQSIGRAKGATEPAFSAVVAGAGRGVTATSAMLG